MMTIPAREWSNPVPDKKEIQENADFYSARISETSRFVGFGLLAIFYAVKVGPTDSLTSNDCLVTFAGTFGALAVLFDYLQYVSGYAMARSARRNPPDYAYGSGLWGATLFAAKSWFFVLKQIAAVLGSIIVILLVLGA